MISPVYAAILALIYVALSVRTLRMRRARQIAVGTKSDLALTRAIRAHANFAEYAPIAIFLIYLLEVQGHSSLLIHALGVALVLGRLIHAFGISQTNENIRFRVIGMVLTLGCLISASLRLLLSALP